MFGEFQSPSPTIQLHPDDAARGRSDGGRSPCACSTSRAASRCRSTINADCRPGVAVMSKGVWLRDYDDGRGVNTLTPATGDPLINGACFNDTLVEVELFP